MDFFRAEALRNARLAIGINIMFYRQSSRKDYFSIKNLLSSLREGGRDLLWYIQMLFRGHLILPLPPLISLLEIFQTQSKHAALNHDTVASFYSEHANEDIMANEIMATYLRFIASPEEEYGLRSYDHRFPRMMKRWQIYHKLIHAIFAFLKPRLYLSIYSGYLHHHTPCQLATFQSIPTLVLGCSDCLYRISDYRVPCQFIFSGWNDTYKPIDFQVLTAAGRRILAARLRGSVDTTISYMKVSAYETISAKQFWSYPLTYKYLKEMTFDHLAEGKDKGFVTVFMHEFNDWHHNGVLPSFATSYYEWLEVTLACMHDQDIPYVLKIHPCIVSLPNLYSASIEALLNLAAKLGVCINVTTSLTTTQLIQAGMKLGVTVRGTVTIELAYLQIPFICAGRPPFATFFPRRLESDLQNYSHRLKNYTKEALVTAEEADMAAYYVALQEKISALPDLDLKGEKPNLSADLLYHRLKLLL